MPNTDKIIIKAGSNYEFVKSVFLRGLSVAAIVYLCTLYKQNPPVIIVSVILCGAFLFLYGNDEITLFQDRFVQKNTSLAAVFFKSLAKEYLISEIKTTTLPEKKSTNSFPNEIRWTDLVQFSLELKNGTMVIITSSVDLNEIKQIVWKINTFIQHPVSEQRP